MDTDPMFGAMKPETDVLVKNLVKKSSELEHCTCSSQRFLWSGLCLHLGGLLRQVSP